jgi:fatty acid desaturase
VLSGADSAESGPVTVIPPPSTTDDPASETGRGQPAAAAALAGFRATSPGRPSRPTSTYSALLAQVRDAGLLERRRRFYVATFVVLVLCLAAAVAGVALLDDSWFQLLVAAGLGVVFTQFAFLAHETSHRQVFESGPVSERCGRLLASGVVGMSYAWWMTKHTRHHGNPNSVGKDPDIAPGVVVFLEADAAEKTGVARWLTARQGWAFFPLLLLEGIALHLTSIRTLVTPGKVEGRWLELALIGVRTVVYVGLLVWLLEPLMALAFLAVQLGVFGFSMGASFAPNHKGMAIIPEGERVDFLSKQVLTSRNVGSSRLMSHALGGLNFQIEHHLFPNMARPHLRRASVLVKQHCAQHGIPYTETTLLQSWGIVVAYLNRVGLAAGGDPFDCPAASQLRPR